MTAWYREWAQTPKARKGRMLPLKAFDTILKYRDPGYASVYMFKEEDAQKLIDSESSVGMNQLEVAADKLTFDIDSGEDGLCFVGGILSKAGLEFMIYESGGKGFHMEIPHDLVSDKRLPYNHKKAAEDLLGTSGVGFIDLSLYQAGRLLSLPGRVHPITKKKKTLLKTFPGNKLKLVLVDPPPKYVPNFSLDADWDKLSAGLFRAADLARNEPEQGNRHVRLWGVSKSLAESGFDHPTVLAIMTRINDSWQNPKKSTEVEVAVLSAFKSLI